MPDVVHQFSIRASAQKVFQSIAMPAGLDAWWTKRSSGRPEVGGTYRLSFGPGHEWSAMVTRAVRDAEFEMELVEAHDDWRGTRVGFVLDEDEGITRVRFHHAGWRGPNEHYRVSCFCWAMYLRLLKRYVERGEVVPHEERLNA